MVRRSFFIAILFLAPNLAQAAHERPSVDWHRTWGGAWSPYRNRGVYVLGGGTAHKWEVDFTALRAEGDVSVADTVGPAGEQKQFDAQGSLVIAGVGASTEPVQVYRSSDGEIRWSASASAGASIGANAASSGRVLRDPQGRLRPEDYAGSDFVGAMVECELDNKLFICGFAIGSKDGVQGGLGYGGSESSPLAVDAAHDVVTLRLSPTNVFPGEGSTLDVTVDASQAIRAGGQATHDCFQRHFPALTRAFDEVAKAVANTWSAVVDLGRRRPATAGFGDDVGRFVETRPMAETTDSPTPNAGFDHGAAWLSR